jgi:hypothetical protein
VSAARLRDMLENMVIAENADLIERYNHPDFLMYSDGMSQNFAEFAGSHRGVNATDISFAIAYDDEAWVEADDRGGGRCVGRSHSPRLGNHLAQLAQHRRTGRLLSPGLSRPAQGNRCSAS